jgi:hypothetical protein
MHWRYKLLAGWQMITLAPGLRAKWSTLWQLVRVARGSRLAPVKAVALSADATVAANAWADFHLLSFVDRPVNVRVIEGRAPRLIAIVPELDPTVIFGGYIAFFQYLAHLQRRDVPVELLVLKPGPVKDRGPAAFAGNALVQDVLRRATVTVLGVGRTVAIGATDTILCYNWTTALVAAKLAAALDAPTYHYFIQEDERVFYPSDSHRFLAESIFHKQPRPRLICNSAKLAAALMRDGLIDQTSEVAVFEQGIPKTELPTVAELAGRTTRRFVFYGRPEDHARRNLMTIAMMALTRAVAAGAFDGAQWEFYMIGSTRLGATFDLGGITVSALPNCDYDTYRRGLSRFDAGMALMSAPHPSVPPFEMVQSAIVTVVNTTAARPDDWYRGISANFEPAEPTVDGLAAAIARAAARVGDARARLAAVSTYHPTDWDQSFAAMSAHLRDPLLGKPFAEIPAAESEKPCETQHEWVTTRGMLRSVERPAQTQDNLASRQVPARTRRAGRAETQSL